MKLLEKSTTADRQRLLSIARAAHVRPKSTQSESITRASREQPLELSLAQQGLWFVSRLENARRAYHIAGGIRLVGRLDPIVLRRALDRILARHEILRTTFPQLHGRPYQAIGPADGGFPLEEQDLSNAADPVAALHSLTASAAAQPFDLERGPLIRGILARIAPDDHALLLTKHHIISDGWSIGVLLNELAALYRAYLGGTPESLPELTLQYADYAAWQRRWLSGEILRRQAEYWKTTLAGAPTLLELPTDRPRPAQADYAGAVVDVTLEPELTRALQSFSLRHGVTLYMSLLAGWAALLSRLSGQDEVVIGSPAANRTRAEFEPMIGFFANTLALRMDVSGSPTTAELLARVKAATLAAQRHQDISFEQVVEAVQPPRSLSHAPLFQAAFAWQNTPEGTLDLPALTVAPFSAPHVTSKFDVALSLEHRRDHIVGGLEYATALFDRSTIVRFIGYWRTLLAAMAAGESQPVHELPLLGEEEWRRTVEEWNATRADFPKGKCVHERIEEFAESIPDSLAVIDGDRQVSFGGLNAQANRLARHLLSKGIQPGMRIAILLERSFEMVCAQLAVLKCGGVFVALDRNAPDERQAFILADCAADLILTMKSLPLPEGGPRRVNLDEVVLSEYAAANIAAPSHVEAALHITYTSGSTGRPKGIIVPHRAVLRIALNNGWSDLSVGDRFAYISNPAWDANTLELWVPLLNGACVVAIDQNTVVAPGRLERCLLTHSVNTLWLTVGLFHQYADALASVFPRLRYLLVGGDAPDPAVIARVLRNSPPQQLVNGYGPTETTVFATTHPITHVPENARSIPLGRPIHNTQIYILDANGQPQPIGVIGEIHIGGAGLAQGYVNRPDLTVERMLPDPFSPDPGARMYKSGDLGRWLDDGTIEFLGRNDFQVKIRGFRIELGEIEAALTKHPQVSQGVVIARENGEGGKQLVAYYTGRQVSAEALRSHMAACLPEYMTPSAYVHLEVLPLTSNGKLDRRALPAPGDEAYAACEYEPPASPTEMALAEIWQALLKVERVGRRDNFFALGGHSLLVLQVLSRLRQTLGVEMALTDVFLHPVLADFALAIDRAPQAELPPILNVNREQPLELSLAQQGLWFVSRLENARRAYHIAGGIRLVGRLDPIVLRRALDRILARHEILRTTFPQLHGRPYQAIGPADGGFPLEEQDLSNAADPVAALHSLTASAAAQPFDLERGPLIRGILARIAPDDHALLLTKHHIISDGWSIGVLLNELAALYRAYLGGTPESLPELTLQYADYAAWQRRWLSGEILRRQAEYWKTTLAGAPTLLELPTDRPRPAQADYAGAVVDVTLEPELTRALQSFSLRHGVTLYMSLLAGWAALLSRLSGQDEVVIGSPAANRTRAEFEPMIGFFANTLALRMDVSGSPTTAELLARVKAATLAAQRHQDISFEQVVEAVQPPRSLSHAPLFQAAFAWQNTPEGTLDLPALTVSALPPSQATAKVDLLLALEEREGCIAGGLEYATALFDRSTILRYAGYWRALLGAMIADPGQPVDRLPMLAADEQRRILEEWTASHAAYPSGKCAHELFELQAARLPEAVALIQDGESVTYAELDFRANQLAHYLCALGVGPDQRVAVCMERGIGVVVAMLATLKGGGAYVPLDPAYASERLASMLEDCAPVAVLTHGPAGAALEGLSSHVAILDLDAQHSLWSSQPGHSLAAHRTAVNPDNVAYMIYTSGSTGVPKGVMVEHRNLVNLIHWHHDVVDLRPGDSASCTSGLGFDAAVCEIWPTLCAGATLTLPSAETARNSEMLMAWWQGQPVAASVFATPIAEFALSRGIRHSTLRCLMTGGDRVQRTAPDWASFSLVNNYGPTETSVIATSGRLAPEEERIHIGRPISNTQIYILDRNLQPVPEGVAGELYIGGAGVSRGYLRRPHLTAERFLCDPFSHPGSRMYRTGDLGRWLPDGRIDFLGRNDFQVKIRGFRIEPGEIEAALAKHPHVRETVVLALDGDGGKRLVAYYTGQQLSAETLRAHLLSALPEYMVPSVYVYLPAMPLTPNGKIDRRGLPAPDRRSLACREYAPPATPTEILLAGIWADLLKVERVGRHDNFFELGGHSLLAVALIERMRRERLALDVRTLFAAPSLQALAEAVAGASPLAIDIPANAIEPLSPVITPEMLPLVRLTQGEIDSIVATVPGGAANVQDIYPLAPLQEGILFHHLMSGEGDAYLLQALLAFDSRARLDQFTAALERVVARHDILRTAVVWEELPEPVQVVWREAPLAVELVALDRSAGDAAAQLRERFDPRRMRMDVRQAPLIRCLIAPDHEAAGQRWLLLWLSHHLAVDHVTLEQMVLEAQAHLQGDTAGLPAPAPFRNFVAQARLGASRQEHEAFFREMLGDVEEPTAPFGLVEAQGDGRGIEEARIELGDGLADGLRERARALGVSVASLCHVAWAQVLGRVSGKDDVVFGTVLLGRMESGQGAAGAFGLFINTLPVRIRVGHESVAESVRQTHALLARLIRHEHASLALAQRASGVAAPTPLFSALLNYRHSRRDQEQSLAWEGVEVLSAEERSNYPLSLSVDDLGDGFALTAQAVAPIGAARICGFAETALRQLVDALGRAPETELEAIDVLPEGERRQVLEGWNATEADYPGARCIHELFERHAAETPDAIALVQEEQSLSYGELNGRANRLAHYLRGLGVGPAARVAICMERSAEVVIAMLATLKAGGAYVPLDPAYPRERLAYMLRDSAPVACLTNQATAEVIDALASDIPTVDINAAMSATIGANSTDLDSAGNSSSLAYVIYTSGSTGQPKGVMVEHRGLVNMTCAQAQSLRCDPPFRALQFASLSFDASFFELAMALCHGGTLVLLPPRSVSLGEALIETVNRRQVSHVTLTPSVLASLPESATMDSVRVIVAGGEALPLEVARRWTPGRRLVNGYGPTETSIWVTQYFCQADAANAPPIGTPIANARIYVLDSRLRPAPAGVAGEIYIAGAGVARGYIDRPGLTSERFLPDSFSSVPGSRMYRTGDLGRWLPNGEIEFLGRTDFQVKIRGFRIELGEIESRLASHPRVRNAVVVVQHADAGRLLAYYTGEAVEPAALRAHLSASLPEHMIPAVYIYLQALPITPGGKLDRNKLPIPETFPVCVRAAPIGRLETRLAAIWAETFALESVGRHDNFFDLGGHSLLAICLVSNHAKQGISVSIADLFKHPTIASLAERLEPGDVAAREGPAAIPVRVAEAGALSAPPSRLLEPPLFLVHDISGEIGYAASLASRLPAGIPVYALAAPGPSEQPMRTIQGMAERMVRMIRDVQPEGPYRLAGWSLGATLAYEIAAQLIGRDASVEFLGSLDGYYFGPGTDAPFDETHVDDEAILSHIRNCQSPQVVALSAEEEKHYLDRYRRHLSAARTYVAQPIPVPLHLFSATDGSRLHPLRNWDRFLPAVQIHNLPVPGTHVSMMDQPHIARLAEALSGALRQARKTGPPQPEKTYCPMMSICDATGGGIPVLCIPGAGGTAVSFLDLANRLRRLGPVEAVQPRGLDGILVPHSSVEAAARSYLLSVAQKYPSHPLHLVGHSFGGWISLEMAHVLRAAGRPVASLTLLDADPPDWEPLRGREYSRTEAIMELVDLYEQSAGRPLGISAADIEGLDTDAQWRLLSDILMRVGLMPKRSQPADLIGVARSFETALRARYIPESVYSGPVQLVLARKDAADAGRDFESRLSAWKRWLSNISVLRSEGNHMTLLRPPHSSALGDWVLSILSAASENRRAS